MDMIIYKATNTITGLIYIGMTRQPLSTRASNHKARAKNKNRTCQIFHDAINEHGFNSFTWEVIDSANDYNTLRELEKKWIVQLDSSNPLIGYNSQKNRVTVFGEDAVQSKLNNRQVARVKQLINAGMRNRDIAKEVNIPVSTIAEIKAERTWKHVGEPIKKEVVKKREAKLSEPEVNGIKLLISEGLSTKEIAELTGVKRTLINSIKAGRCYNY